MIDTIPVLTRQEKALHPSGGAAPSDQTFKTPIVHQFLTDLFGNDWGSAWVCSVPGDPNDQNNRFLWKGDTAVRVLHNFRDDQNLYYSTGLVSGRERKAHDFVKTRLFWLDDVGSKVDLATAMAITAALGDPRWVVETSPGSFQWLYRLDDWIDDRRIVERVMDAAAAKGWTDPGTKDCVRAMRLPAGINGKPKYGTPSPKVTGKMVDRPDLKIVDLCRALGLDPIETFDPDSYASTGILSRDGGTVDLGTPDMWVEALMNLGKVLNTGRNDGVLDIVCPFVDEHTTKEESGTAYFGGGAFKCHHGHCVDRNNFDFKAKICELHTEEGHGSVAALAFDEIDPDEEARVNAAFADLWGAARAGVPLVMPKGFKSWADVYDNVVCLEALGAFFDRKKKTVMTEKTFNLKCSAFVPYGSSGLKSAAAQFANSRGTTSHPVFVHNVTYIPGGDEFVIDDDGDVLINSYKPPSLKLPDAGTVKDADVKAFLDHMDLIFSDPIAKDVMLDWMAHNLQKPGVKINWCPVILGGQGVGKDLMLGPLKAGVGLHNVSQPTSKALTGDFNAGWIERQIIIWQEFSIFGKIEAYDKLKNLITAPPETVEVNQKMLPTREIPNTQNHIAVTNHADALRISEDDRRFWVWETDAEKQDESYYGFLVDWFETGGNEKVVRWLLDRKIGAGFSTARPPADIQGHKAAMVDAATPDAVHWVTDQVEGGLFKSRKILAFREVVDRARVAKAFEVKDWAVREALSRLGWVKGARGEHVRLTDGRKVRLWVSPEGVKDGLDKRLGSGLKTEYEAEIAASDDLI